MTIAEELFGKKWKELTKDEKRKYQKIALLKHLSIKSNYKKWRIKNNELQKQWRKNNLEYYHNTGYYADEEKRKKRNCRIITNNNIEYGKLKRKPCEICGKKAEAHHKDYNKPLDVKWLCLQHHVDLHNLLK